MHLTVAVATYCRPADIARCLSSLQGECARFAADHDGCEVNILVVDNDAVASARTAVADSGPAQVRYVIEPTPGISAARNRALDEAHGADLLVFIDDDETVQPGWLGHLITTHMRHGSTAVAGRVVSHFDGPLDPWLEAGGFFTRRSLPTGTLVRVAATNNLLLDLPAIRRYGLRFDRAYGLTGGSDTDFTGRIVEQGGTIAWCQEAVVVDHVPSDRATRSWVLARARRTGNSEVVVRLNLARGRRARAAVRGRSAGRGAVRIIGGCAQIAIGRALRRVDLDARGHKALHRGRGMVAGVRGRRVSEYHRDAASPADVTGPPAPLRVLASFRAPRPTTNPYIVQLAAALDATPGVDLLRFSWRTALLGRYDVVHLHWPEVLLTGRDPVRRGARGLLFGVLMLRWSTTRTPVVRTMHNRAPHEGGSVMRRTLLAAADRLTSARILLNATEAGTPAGTVVAHGHYRDWFDLDAVPAPRRHRLVFAGLIRPYKNVSGLVDAFRDLHLDDATLHVVGSVAEVELAEQLRHAAVGDARVRLDLRFLPDTDLAREIGESELVVLPYQDLYNSGALMLALSLNRPVLVPDNATTRMLACEVGDPWVQRYSGVLGAADLARAFDAVHGAPAGSAPDLSARSWAGSGQRHAEVYLRAWRARRRRWRGRSRLPESL